MAAAPRKKIRLSPQKEPQPQPDWQIKMQTVECQNIYAMEKEIWTDCSFLVGKPEDNVEEIRCHKYQLAKCSPTIAAMLFGDQALKNPNQKFQLDSITPVVFKAFLRYAYTGKVKYTGVYAESWELLNFGKKFRLPDDMLNQCRGHLWAYMSDGWNAWTALQQLSMCEDEPRLQAIAQLRMNSRIDFEHDEVMKDFLDLPQEAIIFLLQSDEVTVEEGSLIDLCCKWAKHKVTVGRTEGPDNTTVTPDPQAYRAALEPLLSYFRFLAVNGNDEWNNLLGETSNLPQDMIDILKKYRETKDESVLPKEYSRDTDSRGDIYYNHVREQVYVYGVRPDDEDIFTNMLKMDNVYQLFYIPDRMRMKAQHDEIRVRLPTQIRPDGVRSRSYEEDFTIVIVRPYEYIFYKSRFTSLVNYDTYITFPMKLPATLHMRAYSTWEDNHVIAIPHKSGTYPAGWFTITSHTYDWKKLEAGLEKDTKAVNEMEHYKNRMKYLHRKIDERY